MNPYVIEQLARIREREMLSAASASRTAASVAPRGQGLRSLFAAGRRAVGGMRVPGREAPAPGGRTMLGSSR